MNFAPKGPWPQIAEVDALLMDVARRIQLTRTKHEVATRNFNALCQHVDREGSPLHGLVIECYPSGSFATGTAIASQVRKNQHDVDVVIELNVSPTARPNVILSLLFEAINGDEDSRYHGKVQTNSRCVTVTYDDGTTVDLMPVARLASEPARVGNLFHYKPEKGEEYHKAVNPWGFAELFNKVVEFDPVFADLFRGRRLLVEGASDVIKSETQPMPEHELLEEKSPRVVALQLIKRNRDIVFRSKGRGHLRKPPAVALNAMALDAGQVKPSLVDETIGIANHIRSRLRETNGPRGVVEVRNPAYPRDAFTDRWPENPTAQQMYDADLRRFIVALNKLKSSDLTLAQRRELLLELFGESAATYAIESHLDAKRVEMEAGRFHLGERGKVLGTLAAPAIGTRTTSARAATREGGGRLPE